MNKVGVPMRIVGLLVLAAFLAEPAWSQTPPSTLLIGTVAHTLARSPSTTDETWCSADRGSSIFQRSGSGPARIAIPEVSYSLPTTNPNADAPVPIHYTLAGRAQLIFSTVNSGKIYFDYVTTYPTTISQPNFTNYKQTYNSGNGVLTVVFTIEFPSCSLLVAAAYRT